MLRTALAGHQEIDITAFRPVKAVTRRTNPSFFSLRQHTAADRAQKLRHSALPLSFNRFLHFVKFPQNGTLRNIEPGNFRQGNHPQFLLLRQLPAMNEQLIAQQRIDAPNAHVV